MKKNKMKWKQRLENAIKTGVISQKMEDDSCLWDTCYIGENRALMKRCGFDFLGNLSPKNNKLHALGVEFCIAVVCHNPKGALVIAEKIDELIEKKRKDKQK